MYFEYAIQKPIIGKIGNEEIFKILNKSKLEVYSFDPNFISYKEMKTLNLTKELIAEQAYKEKLMDFCEYLNIDVIAGKHDITQYNYYTKEIRCGIIESYELVFLKDNSISTSKNIRNLFDKAKKILLKK